MIRPRELDDLPSQLVELWAEVEARIIADMARRLSRMDFIPSAQWQFIKLQEMGNYKSYLTKALASTLRISEREVVEMMERAGFKALKFDNSVYRRVGLNPLPIAQSPALQSVVEAGAKQTNSLFSNLTRTTAATATGQFERALDQIWLEVTSGGMDQASAIRQAVTELAREGIEAIRYPTGHVDHIDVAVRRAALTGVSQTAGRISEANAQEMGCDLMQITAHAGARPEHALWQGKVVSLSGRRGYLSKSDIGYGTGAGFKGWNCRHDWYPYFPGISSQLYGRDELEEMNEKTVSFEGQTLTLYEATQRQRAIERKIRQYKRTVNALEAAGMENRDAKVKLREWQALQRAFLRETGLTRQPERERVIYTPGKGLAAASTSDILKEINIEPIPITQEAKERIPLTPTALLTPDNREKLRKAQQELLTFVEREEPGVEAAACYDLDMNLLDCHMGTFGKVKIQRFSQSYLVLHNHPSGNLLSEDDVQGFAFCQEMQAVCAVGNNGAIYWLERTENFDFSALAQLSRDLAVKYPDRLDSPERYVAYMEELLKGAEQYGAVYIEHRPQ